MHHGKSRGKENTCKVCKNTSIIRIQGEKFCKSKGERKISRIGGNKLKQGNRAEIRNLRWITKRRSSEIWNRGKCIIASGGMDVPGLTIYLWPIIMNSNFVTSAKTYSMCLPYLPTTSQPIPLYTVIALYYAEWILCSSLLDWPDQNCGIF